MFRSLCIALLVATVGCSRDQHWEKSRQEYCQELELLAHDISVDLDIAAASARDANSCAFVSKDLRTIGARMRGFSALPHVLARARPDGQTIEDAGFVMSFGDDALQRYTPDDCSSGNTAKAAEQVLGIKTKIAAGFEEGLNRCRAIGWKTTLNDSSSR